MGSDSYLNANRTSSTNALEIILDIRPNNSQVKRYEAE